jgi:hypothetical protein
MHAALMQDYRERPPGLISKIRGALAVRQADQYLANRGMSLIHQGIATRDADTLYEGTTLYQTYGRI